MTETALTETALPGTSTEEVARRWFTALTGGDIDTAFDCLAEDVEWINYTPVDGFNTAMAWIGTYRGREAVRASFLTFVGLVDVRSEELVDLVVTGDEAAGIIRERSTVKATGLDFEIEFVQWLRIRDGKIVRWKSYTDPSQIIRALGRPYGAAGDVNDRLLAAVGAGRYAEVESLLRGGADPGVRDPATGLTALMTAAGRGDEACVRLLLRAGADVHVLDDRAGATALHKACQSGSVAVARLLVEAGAFVDAVAPTTGHTPLMDALWFAYPDLVAYLLEQPTGLNLYTHYGFSLREHVAYELNVNTRRREQLRAADARVQARTAADDAQSAAQRLMAATVAGDVDGVRRLLAAGEPTDQRFPHVNGFNDGHMPLHVAARDGHAEIVEALLAAGADVNAVEPVFGAVPLHKAVYNGHADITATLVAATGVDLDFQGATNGYTPLHDALWHGYPDCAQILLDAGARTDLPGHDGKRPADIAADVLGPDHPLTRALGAGDEYRIG
jgi:uncharacterized protein